MLTILGLLLSVAPGLDAAQHPACRSFAYPAITDTPRLPNRGPDMSKYRFKWQDEFNGTKLDRARWHYADSGKTRGYGTMLKANVLVSHGTLKLLARKIAIGGNVAFSTGMISTEKSFHQRYGYFEVKAKMHSQVGPHSAFWLLAHSVGAVNARPNPSVFGAEIDVFEYHQAEGIDNIYMTLHWNGYNFTDGSHQSVGKKFQVPGISSGFHLFALEWTPSEYVFYVDGVEMARTSIALSHIPQFLLLSIEVNGFGGDRYRMIDNTPDFLEVDYIKVYELKPAVSFFGDCDYYGWVSARLMPGNYTAEQLKAKDFSNNLASSLQVPRGWRVIAYDGEQFTGDSVVFTRDNRCIGSFNDRISSLRIIGQ